MGYFWRKDKLLTRPVNGCRSPVTVSQETIVHGRAELGWAGALSNPTTAMESVAPKAQQCLLPNPDWCALPVGWSGDGILNTGWLTTPEQHKTPSTLRRWIGGPSQDHVCLMSRFKMWFKRMTTVSWTDGSFWRATKCTNVEKRLVRHYLGRTSDRLPRKLECQNSWWATRSDVAGAWGSDYSPSCRLYRNNVPTGVPGTSLDPRQKASHMGCYWVFVLLYRGLNIPMLGNRPYHTGGGHNGIGAQGGLLGPKLFWIGCRVRSVHLLDKVQRERSLWIRMAAEVKQTTQMAGSWAQTTENPRDGGRTELQVRFQGGSEPAGFHRANCKRLVMIWRWPGVFKQQKVSDEPQVCNWDLLPARGIHPPRRKAETHGGREENKKHQPGAQNVDKCSFPTLRGPDVGKNTAVRMIEWRFVWFYSTTSTYLWIMHLSRHVHHPISK